MYNLPDERGHFGQFGGVFVAETLVHALDELRASYEKFQKDPEFVAEYERELKYFVGRPSPIYHAQRWSEMLGGAQMFLKREDLNHTGAHKINNVIGQALLAKRLWWLAAPIVTSVVLVVGLYLLSTSLGTYLDPRTRLKSLVARGSA